LKSEQIKTLIFISFFFRTIGLFAQNSDSIGIDDDPILNKYELELMNSLLYETRKEFNFNDKKVAFVTGNMGGKIVSKSEYFQNSVIPWIQNDSELQIYMLALTDDEKLKSGGYDVLVLSWVKIFSPKTREKVISQLGIKK